MDIWTPVTGVVVAVVTAGGSYMAGRLNSRVASKNVDTNAQAAFTDDVMAMLVAVKADSAELFALRRQVVELQQKAALSDIREASCKQQLDDMQRTLERRQQRVDMLEKISFDWDSAQNRIVELQEENMHLRDQVYLLQQQIK